MSTPSNGYIPNSALSPYITVTDFLARFDLRTVAQLVSDDNTFAGVNGDPTNPANVAIIEANLNLSPIPTNVYSYNLNISFLGASGRLEAALLIGNRYQPSDLQNLNGSSLEYLKDIIAGLAIMRLYRRRGGMNPSEVATDRYEEAIKAIEELEQGHQIFSFVQVQDAGLPDNAILTIQEIAQRSFMTWQYQRFFGLRGNVRRNLPGSQTF